jgi:DHA1 family multidrug resistance protein-like MFS transporter
MNKKQLIMIAFMLTSTFIGFGIIIPIMPNLPNVTHLHMNVMLAIYSAASFVMSPIWGAWSDRIGRRKIILIGLLGYFVSFLLLSFSLDHLWLMYISRLLGGLFSGAVISCAVAYVADITTDEERTRGMAIVGMSIGFGFIIGPGVGGLLSVFGNQVPFLAAAALSLIIWVVAQRKLTESLTPEKRQTRNAPKVSRWTAFQGRMKYLYALGFFVSFTLAALEGTLQYFQMERIGITSVQMGGMLFASGIVGALIQGGIVRRYVKNGFEGRVILIGLLLTAAGFSLLLLSSNLWNATLFLLVFSAGNALLRPCVTSLITQKTTVGQGVATGLSSSMDSLGRICGPLFATGLYYFGINLPFIAGAVLSIGSIWLVYRFMELDRAASVQ